MAFQSGSRVRFVADSRNGDWRKGQIGTIEKVIATPPQNTNTIYIIWWKSLIDIVKVWATEKDIESAWDQLSIFEVIDALAKEQASSDTQ